jgi:hypothetical protein
MLVSHGTGGVLDPKQHWTGPVAVLQRGIANSVVVTVEQLSAENPCRVLL